MLPESTMRVDHDLLVRIRMEYLEMPGLQLTNQQARRLWNLPQAACDTILASLVQEDFLALTSDGTYLRRGSGRHRFHAPKPDASPSSGGDRSPNEDVDRDRRRGQQQEPSPAPNTDVVGVPA